MFLRITHDRTRLDNLSYRKTMEFDLEKKVSDIVFFYDNNRIVDVK